MKSPSLVFRLALLQQALAAAIILVFSASAIWLTSRTLERQEGVFLTSIAAHTAENLTHEWNEESDLKLAAQAALEEGDTAGVRLDIFDAQGRLVASSASTAQKPPRDVRTARIGLARGASVVASMSTRPRRDAIAALSLALLLTAVPLWIAVVALSRALAKRALRPLSRMAAQAEQAVAPGTVDALGRPGDPAEIATLADAFNRLLARLDETLRAEQHFTQDAAHELRTPLTVVRSRAEVALQQPRSTAEYEAALRGIELESERLGGIVEKLLLLARADTGELPIHRERLFLDDVTLDATRAASVLAQHKGVELTLGDLDEVPIQGDPTLIRQLVMILLDNAVKFTPSGGRVTVRVTNAAGRPQLDVSDTGGGIAAEHLPRVFERFFRGDPSRARSEGAGLGLAIARWIADEHGAEIRIDSELGRGTHAIVRFA